MKRQMLYLASVLAVTLGLLITIGCAPRKVDASAFNRLHSIVRLHEKSTGRFFCSAVVVSPNLAFTAAHCVEWLPSGEGVISVRAHKDSTMSVDASVVNFERRSDQAIITGNFSIFNQRAYEVDPKEQEKVWLSSSKLVACGFPYAGDLTCTRVRNVDHFLFQFSGDGFLYPGMSGGPIIDLNTGKVIGVNTAVMGNRIILSPVVNIFDNLQVPEHGPVQIRQAPSEDE